MPATDWEDLTEFLDLDEFAVNAEIALQDGAHLSVAGLFDDPYLNAQIGEYELDTSRPRLTCRTVDVGGVQRGDEVTIKGETFDVLTFPQGDGEGMSMLDLARRHE